MIRQESKKGARYPSVIPPKTTVELIRADKETPEWQKRIGKRYRIGYYSERDGLDVIWLVDEDGRYCETTDRVFLLKYFKIIKLSNEQDYYGKHRSKLKPLKKP